MFQDSLSVVRLLLADLNSPRSLTVKLLIDYGEWDQLVKLECDPSHYLHPDSYFRDAIATDLLRKNADIPTSFSKKRASVDTFITAEKQCCATNRKLRPILEFPSGPLDPSEWRIADFLRCVKRRIKGVLGRLPDDLEFARFGPGATLEDKGRSSTIVHKMQSQPTVTKLAKEVVNSFWSETAWSQSLLRFAPNRSEPKIVIGNRFTSVPKTAVTDRGICVEPSLNVFYQLAVGSIIRGRLMTHAGLDLDKGQGLHRTVSRQASLTGAYATIDLSNASDTIAALLVKAVLPDEWFQLLDSLRSPFTMVGNRRIHLQKFSSMGNGFTFELETLIFWAIASEASKSRRVYTYGDDIIVPTENAVDTLAWLRELGFTPNVKKTFTNGWFRESCGGDFFRGAPVRSFFLESFPTSPPEWFAFHNGLKALDRDYLTRRARGRILDLLPKELRTMKGPRELGDSVLHSDFWGRTPVRGKPWIYHVRGIRPIVRKIRINRVDPYTLHALALYGIPSSGFAPRGEPTGYKKAWFIFS